MTQRSDSAAGEVAFYADHNATTPVDPRVLECFLEVERDCPGNPSSAHAAGRRARAVLEAARRELAAALDVEADGLCFLASGTEANNLVIAGAGDVGLPVLCGPHEHASVCAPAERRGVVWWRCDGDGRAMIEAPTDPVGMLALCHAQSELGTLQPIGAAAALAGDLGVPLHVDAAQTPGREPLTEVLAVADSVAFSAHKCGGLRGGSVLWTRGRRPRPLLLGGGQERGLRSGTPSVAMAAAAARALALAVVEQPERCRAARGNRDRFVAGLLGSLPGARMVTPGDDRAHALANTAMIAFPDVDGRLLLPALDLAGVQVSQGSACSSGSPEPPAVLAAIGLDATAARRCVRFSFATKRESDGALEDLVARVVAVVRRLVQSV